MKRQFFHHFLLLNFSGVKPLVSQWIRPKKKASQFSFSSSENTSSSIQSEWDWYRDIDRMEKITFKPASQTKKEISVDLKSKKSFSASKTIFDGNGLPTWIDMDFETETQKESIYLDVLLDKFMHS